MLPKCIHFLKQALDGLWETVLFQTKALTTQLNERELICLEENNKRKQAILNDKNMYQIGNSFGRMLLGLINEIYYQASKQKAHWFRTFYAELCNENPKK